jgi:DNA-binding MarR family transcriptional regulator
MPDAPLSQRDSYRDFLLHSLMRAHYNATQAEMARQGLPDVGSPKILFALADYPPDGAPSQKDLAGLLHISPATMAASLKSLERVGYVTRHADERDSRRNVIAITDKGRQAAQTSHEVFRSVDTYMFHGFTQQERDQVFQFHHRMLENLYQIGGDQGSDDPPPPPKQQ